MIIENASKFDLKNLIHTLMRRCGATAQFFFLMNHEQAGSRPVNYSFYVRDVAELVETSRLAQVALHKLIDLEECDANRFFSGNKLNHCGDDFDHKSPKDTATNLMGRSHYCYAEAEVFADRFGKEMNVGSNSIDDKNRSRFYAQCVEDLANIHDACLVIQICFCHLMRASSRLEYENTQFEAQRILECLPENTSFSPDSTQSSSDLSLMSDQKYNTNLAAEFYVLSALHRFGADANLTLGNKKSVDIAVVHDAGDAVTIDVKGLAGKTCWPVDNAKTNKANHFIILICFEDKIEDLNHPPKVYVVPSEKLVDFTYVSPKGRRVVQLSKMKKDGEQYKDAWSLVL